MHVLLGIHSLVFVMPFGGIHFPLGRFACFELSFLSLSFLSFAFPSLVAPPPFFFFFFSFFPAFQNRSWLAQTPCKGAIPWGLDRDYVGLVGSPNLHTIIK